MGSFLFALSRADQAWFSTRLYSALLVLSASHAASTLPSHLFSHRLRFPPSRRRRQVTPLTSLISLRLPLKLFSNLRKLQRYSIGCLRLDSSLSVTRPPLSSAASSIAQPTENLSSTVPPALVEVFVDSLLLIVGG
ncbi:hypothetical protein LWI29_016491 [Acer saccharum]|uniref:Uncharacterized protein n=1 Tax=Acer saccharum TaxID=4024 RepID=A0AA39RS18_ACESA|nr:hypothetical protein LWI29_016491 [Acer saccharum]